MLRTRVKVASALNNRKMNALSSLILLLSASFFLCFLFILDYWFLIIFCCARFLLRRSARQISTTNRTEVSSLPLLIRFAFKLLYDFLRGRFCNQRVSGSRVSWQDVARTSPVCLSQRSKCRCRHNPKEVQWHGANR